MTAPAAKLPAAPATPHTSSSVPIIPALAPEPPSSTGRTNVQAANCPVTSSATTASPVRTRASPNSLITPLSRTSCSAASLGSRAAKATRTTSASAPTGTKAVRQSASSPMYVPAGTPGTDPTAMPLKINEDRGSGPRRAGRLSVEALRRAVYEHPALAAIVNGLRGDDRLTRTHRHPHPHNDVTPVFKTSPEDWRYSPQRSVTCANSVSTGHGAPCVSPRPPSPQAKSGVEPHEPHPNYVGRSTSAGRACVRRRSSIRCGCIGWFRRRTSG